ncbi:hypothetical protein [Sphingomonas xinjiangensis]|uniref:Uncharacterized protein n=1 Tax=Sphingomonas xinjiangensis TaxID=643568 RepID=A0A840YNJ6_9SPHN|nr:hypothetical protein [Sphingomonas xinjiangensis]MBB5709421.1 hypothetical protein [Sphingomonas xinjiangensis]
MQIDLNSLANYVEAALDVSPDFEDDQFAFTFEGARIYCERKRTHFNLHIGAERVQMPR